MNLLPRQAQASLILAKAIREYGAALDASDTGTGKTFTALGTARELGATPLVLCPKIILTPWRQTAEGLGIPILDVLNIEKLKAGNTPYLKKVGKGKFVWTVPRGTMVIYDEAQSASGYKTQNAKILAHTKAYGLPTLMLSATVADSPKKLRAVGYLLGLHNWRDAYSWCLNHGCYQNNWGGLEFITGEARLPYLKKIHEEIFPEKGCRITIADLPDFPVSSIFAEAYDLDRSTDAINKIYAEMDEEISNPDSDQTPLTLQLRARQCTELIKVPLLTELTTDALDDGKSVVIFISFRETMSKLLEELSSLPYKTVSIVGGQQQQDRDKAIAMFQSDEARVAVAMIQAGGVGVSLHDLHGNHPRESIITPPFSAEHLKQALGRTPRANGKTKCIQRIVYAAGTVEEKACKSVRRKLDNISMLNDGDLTMSILDKKSEDVSN